MRGRRSVWSDLAVQRLARRFVLAADEVWRLQGGFDTRTYEGDDPECLVFQAMAAKGHYGGGAGTKQGIYVCAPSGKFLASINSNEPLAVTAMLRHGLAKWKELGAEQQGAATGARAKARFEWLFPERGTALRVTLRYLPKNDDPGTAPDRDYNHDFVWFSREEARRFVAKSPTLGGEHTLPDPLFQRIARFHLVDAVRGETRAFPKAVGSIVSTVTSIEGDVVEITLRGSTDARNTPRRSRLELDAPLGITAQLLGSARYDVAAQRFVAFELVGKGIRWRPARRRRGQARPDRDALDVRSIGWHFGLVPRKDASERIAPTHIREYQADWLR